MMEKMMLTWLLTKLNWLRELILELNEDRVSNKWLKNNTEYWNNRRR